MRERVVAAMSGGVDSSVAALLLIEQGCEVIGLFLRNGVREPGPGGARPGHQGCCSVEDAADARRVADTLGIPFYALDYASGFERIIKRFTEDYQRGRTPSPCVLCNRWLKFGTLVDFARKIGASAVATGHYARVEWRRERDGESPPPGEAAALRPVLLRAADRAKDQTYFLAGLSREKLASVRFPVGHLTKPEVRELARRAGLRTAEKAESMEICFVPGGDYRHLVEARAPGSVRPGDVVDAAGRVVGRHEGFQGYTIGQRRGLALRALPVAGGGSPPPLYVTAIDARANRLVIGERAALARSELVADEVVWTSRPPPAPGEPVRCAAQIRHRHEPAPATAALDEGGRLRVRFDHPVEAVAAGQAIALYDGDVVLAGGFIGSA